MPPTKQIILRHPSSEEMTVRQGWLADPVMMSYNRGWVIDDPGYDAATGCIDFPVSKWDVWYDRWVRRPSDRSYWFIVDHQGYPIGHTFFRLDAQDRRVAHVGINLVPARRRCGLGAAALGLLLDEVRLDGRAVVAVNEFEDTRSAAVRTHRALGFCRTVTAGEGPDGSFVGRWQLTL